MLRRTASKILLDWHTERDRNGEGVRNASVMHFSTETPGMRVFERTPAIVPGNIRSPGSTNAMSDRFLGEIGVCRREPVLEHDGECRDPVHGDDT